MDSKATTSFRIPDLASYCHVPLRRNSRRKSIPRQTKRWFYRHDNTPYDIDVRRHFDRQQFTLLAAVCYPDAGAPQLRVISDFLAYFFFLDNVSDDMDTKDTKAIGDLVMTSLHFPDTFRSSVRLVKMTQDYYKRLRRTATPAIQQRFIESMEFFFQSVEDQARDRTSGVIPSLDSYIALRRDTSGCKTCWVLIEYANNLHLPDEVFEHPVIKDLEEAANDLVSFSNDIYSYNAEQANCDTHNMISVVMHHDGLSLQEAVNFVGELCKKAMVRFMERKGDLPSWGPAVDQEVSVYVAGMEHWMSGILYWSFVSERYFGRAVQPVKKSMVVQLLPKRNQKAH